MATKRVDHTVENLEAGQRDSIRRARAKAAGASKEKLAALPSDAEVNQAESKRLAEVKASEPEPEPEAKGPGQSAKPAASGKSEGAPTTRRSPSPKSSKSEG